MNRLFRVIDRIAKSNDAKFVLATGAVPTDFGTEVETVNGIVTDTPELRQWRSKAGLAYSIENYDPRAGRAQFLRELLKDYSYNSVLEVGCNWGNNLNILAEDGKKVFGIDPIEDILHFGIKEMAVATTFALPFPSRQFDLVLCAGVLCHIASERVGPALKEIERIGKQYTLVIDYIADREEPVNFRGTRQLWKRDFESCISGATDLSLLDSGYTDSWDERSPMKYALWEKNYGCAGL